MKHIKTASACLLLIVLSAGSAWASGYQLNEYSAANLGRAFAGAGIVGDDYSAIAFNPAGMTLKGSGGQIGVTVVQMRSNVTGTITPNAGGRHGRLRVYRTLPHGFGQYKLNDNVYMGIGVYTPFGLASEYNTDWFGRWHGTKTDLTVVDVAPAIAIKPNERLSIGASLIYRYVKGDLINEIQPSPIPVAPGNSNRMDLDSWEFAYNFGMMFEPIKGTRLGAAYRLNTAQTVTGKNTISGTGIPMLDGVHHGKATMKLPDQLTLSAYQKIGGKFGLTGTARWTKWRVFDDFILKSSVNGYTPEVIPEQWKNIWTYSIGVDYYHSPEWTLRTGLSYDPTPITAPQYRTARIPDSDRYWLTIGASYKRDNFTVDAGLSHLFMRTGKIENTYKGSSISAKADNSSNMLSLAMQYDF